MFLIVLHLTISGDIFWLSHFGGEDATGIQRVEARGAAKYPVVHGTGPTTKIYLAPNIKRNCLRVTSVPLLFLASDFLRSVCQNHLEF